MYVQEDNVPFGDEKRINNLPGRIPDVRVHCLNKNNFDTEFDAYGVVNLPGQTPLP